VPRKDFLRSLPGTGETGDDEKGLAQGGYGATMVIGRVRGVRLSDAGKRFPGVYTKSVQNINLMSGFRWGGHV